MFLYAVLFHQCFDLLRNCFFINGFVGFSADEKHVFRSIVYLDKLHNLGLVAAIFEHQGTDGVGYHNCLTLKEDAIFCNGVGLARFLHLVANLLMAARGTDYQLGVVADTF